MSLFSTLVANVQGYMPSWMSPSSKRRRDSFDQSDTYSIVKKPKRKKKRKQHRHNSHEEDPIEVIDSSEDEEEVPSVNQLEEHELAGYLEPTLLSSAAYVKWAAFGETVWGEDAFLKLECKRWCRPCLFLTSDAVGASTESVVPFPKFLSLDNAWTFHHVDASSPPPFVVLKVIGSTLQFRYSLE
jgi:hypothetical protein